MNGPAAQSTFDLKALYEALDDRRRLRGMTWTEAAREINRFITKGRPIATSTITGLKTKPVGEGDGILQMLLWLDRAPESFVPGMQDVEAERFRLREPEAGRVLRWDTRALHAALNAKRRTRGLTWNDVAQQIGGVTPRMLTNLAKGGRTALPGVMRIVAWLGQPAATLTRVTRR